MSVYVVTWNINREKSKYAVSRENLLNLINTYDNRRDEGLETVRFISTKESANVISDKLFKVLDDDDRLLVSRMNPGEYYGWLDKGTWDWINARL